MRNSLLSNLTDLKKMYIPCAMDLRNYKIDEEILSPEKFPLDEFAQYFRRGDQITEGGKHENDNIGSMSALSNLRRSRR